MSKAFQWFIIIGLSIAAIIGHINVLDTAEEGGWMFVACVGIQAFTLVYGLMIAKKLDV